MRMLTFATTLLLFTVPFAVAACDDNDVFEEAGEELDEAVDDVEDALD
jgi:hypothetical protein